MLNKSSRYDPVWSVLCLSTVLGSEGQTFVHGIVFFPWSVVCTASMCWTLDVRHVTLCDFRVMVVWFPALSFVLFCSGIFSLGRSGGVAWRQRPHGL